MIRSRCSLFTKRKHVGGHSAPLAHSLWGLLLVQFCCLAEPIAPPQLHGFLSQGYIYTTDNNFFGTSSDDGSFEYTEVGLNVSFLPTDRLLATAQALGRQAGGAGEDLELDYALVDYRLPSREFVDTGIRVGRIKTPLGLYNDTRDVAFTRPSVILPQSIYFDRSRDIALSGDGVMVYGERRLDYGSASIEAEIVKPRVGNLEKILLGGDRPGSMSGEPSFVSRLSFDSADEKFRVALSVLRVRHNYQPGENDPSGAGHVIFTPRLLSLQYNAEKWISSFEYAQRTFRFRNLSYVPVSEQTGESYYLQTQYNASRNLWAVARYDVLYQNVDDKSGMGIQARTAGRRPAHSQFAKDTTLGLRWQLGSDYMIALENHWVDGTAWLPIEDNPEPTATTPRWRMFMIQISARF